MTQWSIPKLRQYLIEQKIIAHISIRWLGEILRRYKVRLRRTKTWKESTDPLFAQQYRAIGRLYQHRPANGRRLCIDEFGPLNLQPRHGHCYKGPGKRLERIRATYNPRAASATSWPSMIWKPTALWPVHQPQEGGGVSDVSEVGPVTLPTVPETAYRDG